MATETKHHILSVLMENRFGVLTRISGLFARRGFNINSLAVSETEDPNFSRMTIVVEADTTPLEQVTKQLHKLIPVIKITEITTGEGVERELMLVTAHASAESRHQITDLANIVGAQVIEVGHDEVTLSLAGEPAQLDSLTDLLRPHGIVELQRTGCIALPKLDRQSPKLRAVKSKSA